MQTLPMKTVQVAMVVTIPKKIHILSGLHLLDSAPSLARHLNPAILRPRMMCIYHLDKNNVIEIRIGQIGIGLK